MPKDFSPIGINCSASTDSQPFHYINLIKSCRPFGSKEKPWDQANGPAVDGLGYPQGDFGFVPWAGSPHWPGRYQLYTTGKVNKLTFAASTIIIPQSNLQYNYDSVNNVSRVFVDVPEFAGDSQFFIGVDYDEATIEGGVKDLRFFRPGYDSDDAIFTNEYIDSLAPFGILRLMPLSQTNHSVVTGYGNATKMEDCRWVDKGCPMEALRALILATGKVPWFNFPHLMEDEEEIRYVFAEWWTVVSELGLPLYFENSNESWNFGFAQGQWHYQRGKELLAQGDPLGLATPAHEGVSPDELARHRLHAFKTYRLAAIGRDVFGPYGYLLRPLLGAQAAGHWQMGVVMLDWLQEKYGPVKNWLYGATITNYFGGDNPVLRQPGLTPQQVLDELAKASGTQPLSDRYKNIRAHCQRHEIVLTGYEVGPDTTRSKNSVDAKIAAVSSPEMQVIYEQNLVAMWNAGTQEVCGFEAAHKPGPEGTYGHTFDIRKLDTPKRRALAGFAASKRLPAPQPTREPVEEARTAVNLASLATAEATRVLGEVATQLEAARTALGEVQGE
jgi:hypothetical protein